MEEKKEGEAERDREGVEEGRKKIKKGRKGKRKV